MIDLPPLSTSPVATAPSAAKAAASARPASFGQTLKAFLDSRDTASDPPTAATAAADARHDPADDGKSLPTDSDADAPDATPPIWTPAMLPVADPAVPIATPTPVPTAITAVTTGAQPSLTATPPAVGLTDPASGAPNPAPTDTSTATPPPLDPAITAALDAVLTRATTVRQDAQPTSAPASDGAQPPALIASDPTATAIVANAAPQPAGQVFAAALATAWRDRTQRTGDSDALAGAAALGAAAPSQASSHAIVAASGDANQTGLDLTRDTGLQRMIEHIETLRDDMDSRDTRIRLIPDSLGGVDVAVRQVGDRVHVHFTAEQEATRALLTEAQPRLTELAAARGMRIGDTSVSADPGGGNGTAPQPRPAPLLAPAPHAVAADTETPSDARVA
ncbi:flagellar hook-length control protein FliK [Sphingomonas glacialis]|nr:flagellar hook-length control protein FliK [Sphingomonas glacialis]